MAWTPPSVQGMSKLPAIEIIGTGRVVTYQKWLDAHPEVPRTIPPLYRDFCIRFTMAFPRKDGRGKEEHEYIDCVHYSEDLSSLEICHVLDGKKRLMITANYAEFEGTMMHARLSAPHSSPYKEDWLRTEGTSVLSTVIAVQAYILYHRPDIEPVYLDAPKKRRSGNSSSATIPPKKIKNTVRKIIRLSEEDDATDQPMRNYRKIAWQVRGHYRRLEKKDGTQYMTYVKPHTAQRGKKKIRPAGIQMVDPPKEEG